MSQLKNKNRVIWLCHFANQSIIDRFSNTVIVERAPWISNLISIFENTTEIELHIVCPNTFTNKDDYYISKNISYHFYKYRWVVPKKLFRMLKINEITHYFFIRQKIKKIVNAIQPDIIHLHGAENPIYSSVILDLVKKYKTLVTIQGFVHHDEKAKDFSSRQRKRIELAILRHCRNFGVRTLEMCGVLKAINPNALFYWHNYPITKPRIFITSPVKEYDCVFFGRVAPENGVEDLLRAISLAQNNVNEISLLVVGPFESYYKNQLDKLCKYLGISDSVFFTGFLPTQQMAFEQVLKAKIDVLPTYYDIIPGSILECMLLGLPVISYAVGGIPELNTKKESLLLVDKGDYHQLAKKIILLLSDRVLYKKLSLNAQDTALSYNNYDKIFSDILDAYQAIITN